MIERPPAPGITRARIVGPLLALSAAGWALVVWQSAATEAAGMDNMLTMDMALPLFLAVWVAMMVAMMLPSAAPMILAFGRVQQRKRAADGTYVPTWVFTAGYLAVWTAFGALAYAAALGAMELADDSMWLMDNAGRIGGALLILAGVYQLSPLKEACLATCRSPLAFVLTRWRDGPAGALLMGVEHGLYCLGCCWLFFVILFPLGMMNVAILAALVLLILAEKALPFGQGARLLAAAALVGYGCIAVLVPDALPSLMG